MRLTWIRHAVTAAFVCTLLACGGGGGNSGGGSGGGGGPVSGSTGFVPAAPTTGAVLYAQASVLRPLRAGARWSYRTADYTSGSFGQATVKQIAGPTAGAVQEIDSAAPDDVGTVSLDASGNVVLSTQLVLAPGAPGIAIKGIELKATVRADEQLVLFDQRIASSGIDVDGDGRQDLLDLAIWRRVVGIEDVALPNLMGTLRALRVDTFVTARVTPTGGAAPATQSSQVSTWYAPDLGVVREAEPGTVGRALDSERLLLGYDGVTSGWGYLVSDQPSWEIGSVLNRPLIALQQPDGALVVQGQSFLRLDRSGNVIASNNFTPNNTVPVIRGFARSLGGTAVVTGSFPNYSLYAIDSSGALVSSTPIVMDFSGRTAQFPFNDDPIFVGEVTAPVAWAVWRRQFTAASSVQAHEIVVRRIDGSGLVGGEIQVPVNWPFDTTSIRAAARGDGLLLTWTEYLATGEHTNRVALIANAGIVQSTQAWVIPKLANAAGFPALNLLAEANAAWVLWNGPTNASSALQPHGMRLDASAAPVGVGVDTASLLGATINSLDGAVAADAWWTRVVSVSGRWFAVGRDFGFVYPNDPVQRYWLDYRELDPGTGALSGNLQPRMTLRIPWDQPIQVQPIVFADRVLLLTDDGRFVKPTVIWRR